MANSKKPRKKQSQTRTTKELHAFRNIQHLLKDLIIGSVQIKPNAQITKLNGEYVPRLGKSATEAIEYVKFNWLFLLGYVGRHENGVPYVRYFFGDLSPHCRLYEPELNTAILNELRKLFDEADHNTRLTTFWIACPNQEQDPVELLTVFFHLMDEYRVFDNMVTQHEISTNKDVGRSLHDTTYWYKLCDMEELLDDG